MVYGKKMDSVLWKIVIFALISLIAVEGETLIDTSAHITVTPVKGIGQKISEPLVIEGLYTKIGAVENAAGEICLIDQTFLLSMCNAGKDKEWIGVLNLEEGQEEEDQGRDNRGNRKVGGEKKIFKSLTDRVKDLMLLGASALIIMAKTAKVNKELTVNQVFTRPIILLQGVENVTKILQLFSLKYNLYATIRSNVSYYSVVGTIGTVTLWATCGRSTSGSFHEWQGVICMGNSQVPIKALDEYVVTMAWNFAFFLFICAIVFLYIKITRSPVMQSAVHSTERNDNTLAKNILSKLRVEIYRSKGRTSGGRARKNSDSDSKTFRNIHEQCVICLDAFFPMQRLRVLPCNHRFHLSCIDRWLLVKFNCPMCKRNVLENVIQ